MYNVPVDIFYQLPDWLWLLFLSPTPDGAVIRASSGYLSLAGQVACWDGGRDGGRCTCWGKQGQMVSQGHFDKTVWIGSLADEPLGFFKERPTQGFTCVG